MGKGVIKKIIDFLFPMCPQGGHRLRIELVRNNKGHYYCWHKDCIIASFKDIEEK